MTEANIDVITSNLIDDEVVTTNIQLIPLETTMDVTSITDQIIETSKDYNVETIDVSFMSIFIADYGYRF